jgi:hypothetical protein
MGESFSRFFDTVKHLRRGGFLKNVWRWGRFWIKSLDKSDFVDETE